MDQAFLFNTGKNHMSYKFLGSRPDHNTEGEPGYRFAVWAPHAVRVCVVGDFNNWEVDINNLEIYGATGKRVLKTLARVLAEQTRKRVGRNTQKLSHGVQRDVLRVIGVDEKQRLHHIAVSDAHAALRAATECPQHSL